MSDEKMTPETLREAARTFDKTAAAAEAMPHAFAARLHRLAAAALREQADRIQQETQRRFHECQRAIAAEERGEGECEQADQLDRVAQVRARVEGLREPEDIHSLTWRGGDAMLDKVLTLFDAPPDGLVFGPRFDGRRRALASDGALYGLAILDEDAVFVTFGADRIVGRYATESAAIEAANEHNRRRLAAIGGAP